MRRQAGRGAIVLGMAAGLALASPSVAAPAPAYRITVSDSRVAQALEEALEGARQRLARPFCQELLTDFTDAAGRPLVIALAALGQTPTSYLEQVRFVDGSGTAACRSGRVTAATMPGSRVVWVCDRFVGQARESRHAVEIVLIHELLHTLGLEENPPSSAEITVRTSWRCGAD